MPAAAEGAPGVVAGPRGVSEDPLVEEGPVPSAVSGAFQVLLEVSAHVWLWLGHGSVHSHLGLMCRHPVADSCLLPSVALAARLTRFQ